MAVWDDGREPPASVEIGGIQVLFGEGYVSVLVELADGWALLSRQAVTEPLNEHHSAGEIAQAPRVAGEEGGD